ncbi:MAG: Bax inhibitor-1/YccA family protein [Corynebacterium sp.]|nr:Bax inhibitor-1/YccA family protein [Corynebacterium sp.]
MARSNPVFTSLEKDVVNPYAGRTSFDTTQPGGMYAAPMTSERAITIDDIVTKTGITLGVIIVVAALTYGIGLVAPGMVFALWGLGAIGSLVTVLVATMGGKYGSAPVTLTYAVFEGLLVGGISYIFAGLATGINAGALIGQAVVGTLGVFIGMIFVYKSGAVRVTPRFNRIVTGAIFGVAGLALVNILLALFTGNAPLTNGGPLAIIFSLFCIGLAAISFLQDFDNADKLIRVGAPAKTAWGVALGLAVTLVWLYTEILRLLSYFNRSE